MTVQEFFETTVGRKVLVVLSPFFLSPKDMMDHRALLSSRSLRSASLKHQALSTLVAYQSYAPAMGSLTFVSAVLALLNLVVSWGVPFERILPYQSASLIVALVGAVAISAYGAAFARVGAGWVMTRFDLLMGSDQAVRWPLSFWLNYYGGLLMVWGLFVWAVVGVISLPVSWVLHVLLVVMMMVLSLVLRVELKRAQQAHHRVQYHRDWRLFTLLSAALFISMEGILVFLLFPFLKNAVIF